jgi:phage-related minor tail protein
MLTGGQVAGLIVAVFWAILVSFLAFVLIRLAKLLGEATKMVSDIGDQTGPLLDDMTRTVEQANEQLHRMDMITRGVAGVTQNVSAVTTVMTSVVSGPLVKGAAFAYGVRKVLGQGRQPGRELPARAELRARTVDGERT